jgi:hypothetical protein
MVGRRRGRWLVGVAVGGDAPRGGLAARRARRGWSCPRGSVCSSGLVVSAVLAEGHRSDRDDGRPLASVGCVGKRPRAWIEGSRARFGAEPSLDRVKPAICAGWMRSVGESGMRIALATLDRPGSRSRRDWSSFRASSPSTRPRPRIRARTAARSPESNQHRPPRPPRRRARPAGPSPDRRRHRRRPRRRDLPRPPGRDSHRRLLTSKLARRTINVMTMPPRTLRFASR